MAADVLREEVRGFALAEDAGELGPEPAGVIDAESLPGRGFALAWVRTDNHIDMASERSSVESLEIRPYGGIVEMSGAHPLDEDGAGVGFSFDVADGFDSGDGEVDSHVETADAGTKTNRVDGGTSHTSPSRSCSCGRGVGTGPSGIRDS